MRNALRYGAFFLLYLTPPTLLLGLVGGRVGLAVGVGIPLLFLIGFHFFAEKMITASFRPERQHPEGLPSRLKGVRIRTYVSPQDQVFWVRTWPGSPTLWISRGWLHSRTETDLKAILNLMVSEKPPVLTLRTWLTAMLGIVFFHRVRHFGLWVIEWIFASWAVIAIAMTRPDGGGSVWLNALDVLFDRDPMRLLLVKPAVQR